MIQIPVHNSNGEQVSTLDIDEQLLGGEVRLGLLKQAYVRYHANQRQGTVATRNRSRVEGSTRKLYKQKHTGNARRGAIRTNIMRGGGVAHGKVPHSWRLDMPVKMRRLANRNALLAKLVDGEVRLVESFGLDKPNTKAFAGLLTALKIDRSVLLAVGNTTGNEAKSAANLDGVTLTQADRLNAFDMLNHRYLLADKATLQAWIDRAARQAGLKEAE